MGQFNLSEEQVDLLIEGLKMVYMERLDRIHVYSDRYTASQVMEIDRMISETAKALGKVV